MFVPMLNLCISYVFMIIIQTITCDPSCIYDVGDGKKIDVRTLGYDNGKGPKYDKIPNTNPTKSSFSWNGCFPYTKSGGGNCKNAAACHTDINTGVSTLIAKPNEVQFEHHDNVNLLVYTSGQRLLTVYLQCSDSDKDVVTGRQDDAHTFNIFVQSRCCCPDKCTHSGGSSSMSGGAVFLILLVCTLFVYIVGGMIFLKYQRGATGADMIPNRSMWLTVISYAVGGVRYSTGRLRRQSSDNNYEKI